MQSIVSAFYIKNNTVLPSGKLTFSSHHGPPAIFQRYLRLSYLASVVLAFRILSNTAVALYGDRW